MTDPITQIVVGGEGAPNLAVDVQPDDIGDSFLLDVSELDGLDLLGWGAADADAVWLNIVCDVTRVHVARGALRLAGPLTRADAGIATIEVLDADRRFDPLVNADAIHTGTPLRVRAWGGVDPAAPEWSSVLFTAELDELPVSYPRTGPPRVTLRAVDVIGELAAWRSVGRDDPGVGGGDNLLERAQRVLAEVGSSATVSGDSDAAYAATLAPSPLAGGWQDITAAADAELGRVWVNSANQLVVRGRESQLSGPVRGTLSDWHGEAPTAPHCCYEALDAVCGPEQLVNLAIAARRVPSPADGSTPPDSAIVVREDGVSRARYRRRALERRDLELEFDSQLAPWAESALITSSTPELRVDTLNPAPWGAGPEAWQAVCSTDIGDRWLLRYHPELGPTVMRTVGVLGIEHDITPGSWSITWATVPAPTPGANPTGWFALDVSDLDSGDLLAPFGGPVGALPV
jgi:hypothetical protein